MEHKFDAKGKKLGRLASEVAILLMGKGTPDFKRNAPADVKVIITNASLLDIPADKMDSKEYKRYSGYPGGLKIRKMSQVVDKHGYSDVLKKAVYGMLPANKLRAVVMKNLIISE